MHRLATVHARDNQPTTNQPFLSYIRKYSLTLSDKNSYPTPTPFHHYLDLYIIVYVSISNFKTTK